MNEERLFAMVHELTDAVVALAKAVDAGRRETERLCDLVQPIAEALAERGLEGKVAKAIMGAPRTAMSRADYATLRDAVEVPADTGKKIQAIKAIRSATGMGLKEAKDLADKHWGVYESRVRLLDLFEVEGGGPTVFGV